MKITLHIDDGHTPAIIQLLATLIAKSSAYDGNQDPAMGHPELPLGETATTAADPLKVAMDDPVEHEDPTQLIVPIPEDMHPLPPLPEGCSRWVGRGYFRHEDDPIHCGVRVVFWRKWDSEWERAINFGSSVFHIEAIK